MIEEILDGVEKCMSKILVEVDMHLGLLHEIRIEWRGCTYI